MTKQAFQNEMGSLLNTFEEQRGQKLRVDLSELPKTLPSGSVCTVEKVVPEQLGFNDLVVIRIGKLNRVRRFLRLSGNEMVLGGEGLDDIAPHTHGGAVLKISKATHGGRNLACGPKLGTYLSLLRSFVA